MALRVPDYQTFMATDDYNRELWYRFLISVVNNLPQTGNAAPEGVIAANNSCLYTQLTSGASVLWFNQTGSGSTTGWIVK